MGRTRRSDLIHPMLHVWTRGVDRQDIFLSDQDRLTMERFLADAVERANIEIHAYAFMHNHLHLMVDRGGGDLSAGLGGALARYAAFFNRRTERTGPLFSGRFGATAIENDEQALQCSRYIHLNPLEFVPLAAVIAYRWSSLGVYAERRPSPPWLTTDFLPTVRHSSWSDYARFVTTPQPSDRHGRPIRPWDDLTLPDVDAVVADVTNERPARVGSRGQLNVAASIAIAAATELRVASSSEIAEHHRLAAPVSARTAARRARARASEDAAFGRALRTVVQRLRASCARADVA